jgi:DUF4097 and DUF4098 domain-containing protein YvlB
MCKNLLNFSFEILLAGLLMSGMASAQEFQKTYRIAPGGVIRITNVSGEVKVTGVGGDVITVLATKVGSDTSCVQVEDNSSENLVDLRARYPQNGNCNASINFDVRVPVNTEYNYDRLASVSGNVTVQNIAGKLRAESVSGNVEIAGVTGIVSASAVSGNVDVDISQLQGLGDMKFSSISGNVNVVGPTDLDSDVEMSSISGSLKTNYDIEVQEQRYGPGRHARGRIGAGSHSLKITTVSGRVSLYHR